MKNSYFKNETGLSFNLDYVYVEYDGPLFFMCSDDYGAIYLGAASVITNEYESWTLVKVSHLRLKEVINNKITLYDLFKKSETCAIVYIKHLFDSPYDIFTDISISELPDDLLPARDRYLDIDIDQKTPTLLPDAEEDSEFLAASLASYTLHCDLEIKQSSTIDCHEISVKKAGDVLTSFDDLRLSMLLEAKSSPGRISNKFASESIIMLAGAKAASFVFALRARDCTIVDDKTADSLRAIHRLLYFDENTEDFECFLKAHNSSVISRYKKFISVLIQGDLEIGIRTAYPYSRTIEKLKLDRSGLSARKLLLDQRPDDDVVPLVLSGTLYGVEPIKAVFSFLPDDDDDFIVGKVEKSLADEMRANSNPHIISDHGIIYLTKTNKFSIDKEMNVKVYVMSSFVPDKRLSIV